MRGSSNLNAEYCKYLNCKNKKQRQSTKNMSYLAFTLAETLITLAIIGVVAALTIPTIIRNYQKQQTIVALKKAYSQIYQAINLYEADNTTFDNWDYSLSSKDFYEQYLKKFLKVIKDYGNVGTSSMGISYNKMNGDSASGYTIQSSVTYKIVLSDGSMIFINPGSGGEDFSEFAGPTKYYLFYVDTNGFKKPNTFGKDVFVFVLQPKYKLMPYGFGNSQESFGTNFNRATILGTNYQACNERMAGLWCADLIMGDGWKISDDYPW
jgi:type II secretory pathway pseudopilin PulG